MGRPAKRATKVRHAEEFRALASVVRGTPRASSPSESWSVAQIVAARAAQMRGEFRLAARLADAMRTDDALFVALGNRLAPQRSIGVAMAPAGDSARAAAIAAEASSLYGPNGIGLTAPTMLSIHAELVNHGVAFAHLEPQAREDGSRVDLFVRHWPIEHVRYDPIARCFTTWAEGENGAVLANVEIQHGDGEWCIIAAHETEPWKHGALLPAGIVWARHAFANKDWARGSSTHGNAKVIGTLPEGVPLQGSDGAPSDEASAFSELTRAIASAESPSGIKPFGSTIDYLVNSSRAWEVWKELVLSAEKAAARIYLGTDGTLGASGGAPGVSIEDLFGVAETLVQGDLETIERCLLTGVLEPWTALNFGDSRLAPHRRYLMPRPEEDAAVEQAAKREIAFFDAIDRARASGMAITQAWVDATAARYRVVAPSLAAATPEPAVMRNIAGQVVARSVPRAK